MKATKTIISLICIFAMISINAQSIFGVWENRNEETNKVDSYIEVFEKNGKAYAKIIDITDENKRANLCVKCTGKNKNKPMLGMQILNGLEKDGDEWSGGTILDPKNGKVYKCYIALVEKDTLKIRGYIGFSLLGRTAYWYRKK